MTPEKHILAHGEALLSKKPDGLHRKVPELLLHSDMLLRNFGKPLPAHGEPSKRSPPDAKSLRFCQVGFPLAYK